MAVDTRDKRMSMMGFARATVRLFKNPTGTIAAAARSMLEFLYSGIALGPPPTPPVLVADACDTFIIGADESLTVAAQDTSFSVVGEIQSFDVDGCE